MKKIGKKRKKCLFELKWKMRVLTWAWVTGLVVTYCLCQWSLGSFKLKNHENEYRGRGYLNRETSAIPPIKSRVSLTSNIKEFNLLSRKQRNKRKRSINGNGKLRQNLTAINWNMGGRNWDKKLLEIQMVIQEFDPDILVISEANMKLALPDELKTVNGYYMILPKTTQIQNHARLVMLVREEIEVKVMEHLMDQEVAAIWVRISARGRKSLILGAMYREHQFIWQNNDVMNESGSPQNQNRRWNLFVENWKRAATNSDVMVLGDLNLDFLTWGVPDGSHLRMVEKVKTQIETLGFSQMVQGVTRTWPGQPDSNLDHCWVNAPGRLISVKNLDRAASDHNLILVVFKTKIKTKNKHQIIKRDRKNLDTNEYVNLIKEIDWSDLLECENLDIMNDMFENRIKGILDIVAPIKVVQVRNNFRKWITQELKEEMRRDKLRQRARETQRQEDWKLYRMARNKCVKSVKTCKETHYQELYRQMETEKTTKGLYRLTRELCKNKSANTPQTFQQDGKLVTKQKEMADLQMTYFTEKILEIQRKIPVSFRNPHRLLQKALEKWEKSNEREVFEFREISLSETISLIQSMSDSSALGHDDIDPIAIKSAARYLAIPLRRIVNFSLKKGKFIQKWKFAKITPILKSSDLDSTCTSAYRPVSVLTSTSKVVERAAQCQLLKYLEDSKQLNASSHAYRKNYSTTTTLMEIVDEIHQGTEDRKMTSLMAIDQSAAFDLVDHELLLQKLELYNVGIVARDWFREYLSWRTQYVTIGTSRSEMKYVKSGVPQGSVIGPLMFALFTNELSEATKEPNCQDESHEDVSRLFGSQCSTCGILTTYADDSTFTVTSNSRQSNCVKLRRNLDEINCFLTDNKLSINVKKTALTECMIQQKKGKTPGVPPSLLVTDQDGNQKLVEDKIYTRILGANVQSNLGWKMHLEGGNKAILQPRENNWVC